ncbi:hypothetical protein M2323_004683 [Rhodoblastus acidophilus]|nr:hypothetical protein [Rhodoblastus acidophilus]MCW2286881.1 hypothetical protein [Rhodoblastus acidophilus]MCW2335727.1 hypothetical protein [Rhodoblastus acidophilus]
MFNKRQRADPEFEAYVRAEWAFKEVQMLNNVFWIVFIVTVLSLWV